jgi:O-antigen/teichoic acid export membrane protein
MNQRLFAQGAVYAAARLTPQLLGFLLLPMYALYLGQDGYGALSLATSIGVVLSLVLAQGQPNALFRLRFRYQGEERRELVTTLFWYVAASMVAGLLLVALFGFFGSWLTQRFLPELPFLLVLLAIGAECAGSVNELYLRTTQAQQKARAYFLQSAGKALLGALVSVVLVVAFLRGAQGRLEGYFAASVVFMLIGIARLRPRAPWHSDRKKLSAALSYGWPLIWHQLSNWVNGLSDRLIVNHFLGLSAAGLYSMGYKIATLVAVIGTALNQALNAQMFRTLEGVESDDSEAREEKQRALVKAVRSQVVQVALLGMGIGCVAKEVLSFISKGAFARSAEIVPLIVLGMIVFAAYQPFGVVLSHFQQTRKLPLISSSAAAVNVALNFLLVPSVGLQGAALATLLSNGVVFALGRRFSLRWMNCYPGAFLLHFGLRVGGGLLFFALLDRAALPWFLSLLIKLLGGAVFAVLVLRLAEQTPRSLLRAATHYFQKAAS